MIVVIIGHIVGDVRNDLIVTLDEQTLQSLGSPHQYWQTTIHIVTMRINSLAARS